MKGGFSFCGTDIADLGLEYAPELEDTYVFKPAETEVHEETFDGHHGGYFYGATIKPKEFHLRVFFEKNIDNGLMTKFYHLFRAGKSGKLIFRNRPWCYYYATVFSVEEDLLSYRSGTLKINMKAAYPFGRSECFYLDRTDEDYFKAIKNTAFFEYEEMVPVMEFNDLTTAQEVILANPGTEASPVCIAVSGDVGEGVIITNRSNGQKCGVVGLTSEISSDVGKTVFIDGMNGKTVISGGGITEPAFLYHDNGFISLEPAFPCVRDVFAQCDEYTLTTRNILGDEVVGNYIFLNNSWNRIEARTDEHTFTVHDSISAELQKTTIMSMNELYIYPLSSMNISVKFIYKPTFA